MRVATKLVPPLAAGLVRGLRLTMRISHQGRDHLENLESAGQNCILAFWHGRLLMMPYCYRRGRMAVIISRHQDGEFIARTMSWFGHDTIRGSTTRGGAIALKAAVRRLRQGWDVAFTPDGPKGPRFKVQMGVIQAARLSGAPIVPVSFSARPAKIFDSWDRFMLPLPFATGTFFYGRPLEVPRKIGQEGLEERRRELEETLLDLTRRADAGKVDLP